MTATNLLTIEGASLVTEPSIYLLGHSAVCNEGLQQFLADEDVSDWSTDTDLPAQVLPEVAGRLCYMSYKNPRPGGNEAYLRNIVETGHHSVLEHTQWTFAVTGVSRSLANELVRHRHLSPSQLSQRYVDESACRFVVPPFIRAEVEEFVYWYNRGAFPWPLDLSNYGETEMVADWLSCVISERERYGRLTEYLLKKVQAEKPDLSKTDARKIARQTARSVLPNATETKIVITGNARSWRHFTGLRASLHADDEIRILALLIFDELKKTAPSIFYDFEPNADSDGRVHLSTSNIF